MAQGQHHARTVRAVRAKRVSGFAVSGLIGVLVLHLVHLAWHAAFVSGAPKMTLRDTTPRTKSSRAGKQPESLGSLDEQLMFQGREVGSSEQYMLSQLSDGRMVTVHCFGAVLDGKVSLERLRGAVRWAVLRHPMLRAAVTSPDSGEAVVPFLRIGQEGGGRRYWRPTNLTMDKLLDNILSVDDEKHKDVFEAMRANFELNINTASFNLETGPLWNLRLLEGQGKQSALLFTFVHSLDDQISGNLLLDQLLSHMEAAEKASGGEKDATWTDPESLGIPKSLEDALLTDEVDPVRFGRYALSQTLAQAERNVIFPSSMRKRERNVKKNWALDPSNPLHSDREPMLTTVVSEGEAAALVPERVDPESEFSVMQRKSLVVLKSLPAPVLARLRQECRENGVTVTMALAAASMLAASDISHDDLDFGYESYRLLMGLDLRRFADKDWTEGTVAFASGAMDFAATLLPKSGEEFAREVRGEATTSKTGGVQFWDLARASKDAYLKWVEAGYVPESTRLFDVGVRVAKLEQIVATNADNPKSLGRAYTATLSNAGVYVNGKEGKYGSLTLKHLHFGISQAATGSLLAASCITVNGELHVTAIAPQPIVERPMLETFADSIIQTLTLAAEQPLRANWKGMPRTDYPVDIRGGLPFFYVLETPKGELQCPAYDDLRSPTMPAFEVDKYLGVWYELAFHDITQANGCGCTRFNMTRHGLMIEDMFTVSCPWPWKEGVDGPWLPGYSKVTGNRKLNLYTCNMTMYIDPARPGVMKETGFAQEFDNMILELWKDPEISAQTGYEYTRSIQFQCVTSPIDGSVSFTGINFLSRTPKVSPAMMQEMFVRARALGLEPYGANDMHVVEHEGCVYPQSTDTSWMGDRPEWPFPVFTNELGALL